jgi:hypothetical protein
MPTLDELMKPRYKAISVNENHYPGSFWKVGNIIDPAGKQTQFHLYPHLFKPLKWWEHRKPEDMPQYLRLKSGAIAKVSNWSSDLTTGNTFCGGWFNLKMNTILPATLEEYTQYINSKK